MGGIGVGFVTADGSLQPWLALPSAVRRATWCGTGPTKPTGAPFAGVRRSGDAVALCRDASS